LLVSQVQWLCFLTIYQNFQLELNDTIPQKHQDIILSEFCAFHLPATVEKFLDPPECPEASPSVQLELKVNNAFFTMLSGLEHIPYWTKYLRSRKPAAAGNRRFMKVLVQRFLDVAPMWDQYFHNPPRDRFMGQAQSATAAVLKCIQFIDVIFSGLSESERQELFPQYLRDQLTVWCRKWARLYPREELGEAAGTALVLLSCERKDFKRVAKPVRRITKGWNSCGLPGCTVVIGLKACARCVWSLGLVMSAKRFHIQMSNRSICMSN
jgi:hypothetical protein